MTKITRYIQNYLLFGLPLVLICMGWGTYQTEREILTQSSFLVRALWELLSWNLIVWFLVLILFLILLVVSVKMREKTLTRLANLKERDEREEFITGKASRAAYISTLSLLIFLLFLSIFSVSIYRVPESQAINGKRGTVSIGLKFNLLDQRGPEVGPAGEVLFASSDLPLSKSAILLTLIIWQVGVFSLTARRVNQLELAD